MSPAAPAGGVVKRVTPVARHVLVTGGSRKLGRAVVAQLVDDGAQVSVVDLAPTSRAK